MAEALFLVTKSGLNVPSQTVVDGIVAVLINKDDAQTNPQIIADAVAQCVAGGHPLRAGYFDTVSKVSDLAAGALKDNKDCLIFLDRTTQTVEG